VLRKASQIILHRRTTQEGPAMRSAKDVSRSSRNNPSTTREELKLVCRKIADVDALWRINDLEEVPPLKRAA